jgi:Polyprenyl synthetase
VRAVAVVELVHNFSLAHDDIIDGDTLRRHRSALWAEFGVPTATLAGDALLALAVNVLATCPGIDTSVAVRCLVSMRVLPARVTLPGPGDPDAVLAREIHFRRATSPLCGRDAAGRRPALERSARSHGGVDAGRHDRHSGLDRGVRRRFGRQGPRSPAVLARCVFGDNRVGGGDWLSEDPVSRATIVLRGSRVGDQGGGAGLGAGPAARCTCASRSCTTPVWCGSSPSAAPCSARNSPGARGCHGGLLGTRDVPDRADRPPKLEVMSCPSWGGPRWRCTSWRTR